ncbi:hypothetical protein [Candidatus Nitrospira salsa]|nr:MAG: hypothetical protein NPIRA04_02750 [Nitrospirales bacterium]
MKATEKKHLTVRVPEQRDCWDWEILTADGSPLDGWYSASVGIDHSGRYCLHVVFDQFDCVNADGQPIKIELLGVTHRPVKNEPAIPSPRMHKAKKKGPDVDWEWE